MKPNFSRLRASRIRSFYLIILFISLGGCLLFGQDQSARDESGDGEQRLNRLWRYSTGGRIPLCGYGPLRDIYYCSSEDNYLHAVRSSGEGLWRSYIPHGRVDTLAVACDGTLYAGTVRGDIIALNRAGGTAWKIVPFPGSEAGLAGILPLPDGSLIAVEREGGVASFSHTGRNRWRATIFGPGTSGGVSSFVKLLSRGEVDGGKNPAVAFAIAFNGGDVVALDENGLEVWHRRIEDPVLQLLSLNESTENGSTAVLTRNSLSCYSSAGEELWERRIGGLVAADSGPLGLALRSSDGFLTLYDRRGDTLWRVPAGGGSCTLSVEEKGVSLLDEEGWCEVYSREGELKASMRLPSPASPLVTNRKGRIVYGGEDWILHSYEWEYENGAGPHDGDVCGPGRTGDIEVFPVLKEELAHGSRERKHKILDTVTKRLRSSEPMPHKKEYLTVLEKLAGEGVLASEYHRSILSNDYPEIRSRAVELLGIYGDKKSIPFLRSLLANEWDSMVTVACIEALGRLGGMEDGRVLGLFRSMLTRKNYNGTDADLFATHVLEAVQKISGYNGRVSGEVMEILRLIYLGPYRKTVRKSAISVLRGLKGSAYLHFSDYTDNENPGEE